MFIVVINQEYKRKKKFMVGSLIMCLQVPPSPSCLIRDDAISFHTSLVLIRFILSFALVYLLFLYYLVLLSYTAHMANLCTIEFIDLLLYYVPCDDDIVCTYEKKGKYKRNLNLYLLFYRHFYIQTQQQKEKTPSALRKNNNKNSKSTFNTKKNII